MASKKCPKCGEDNPAEAVMCWACYTPLTGNAPIPGAMGNGAVRPGAGAATGKPGPIGAPTEEEGSKKPIDPKLFVVGGLLVLGLVIAGVMNFSGGSSSTDDPTPTNPVNPDGGGTTAGAPAPPAPAPAPPSIPSDPNAAAVAPAALPYNVIVPPNPQYATGTMGILATQANISPGQAASLAKFARNQFARNGKWTGMQIAVFSNSDSARQFAAYQAKRKGAPLKAGDYQQLSGVWSGAPAFYESSGKRESVAYPSRNPNAWWGR